MTHHCKPKKKRISTTDGVSVTDIGVLLESAPSSNAMEGVRSFVHSFIRSVVRPCGHAGGQERDFPTHKHGAKMSQCDLQKLSPR